MFSGCAPGGESSSLPEEPSAEPQQEASDPELSEEDWPSLEDEDWDKLEFGEFAVICVKADPARVADLTGDLVYDRGDGWATIPYLDDWFLPDDEAQDLSAELEALVISIYAFEGEIYSLMLYENGRQVAAHVQTDDYYGRPRRARAVTVGSALGIEEGERFELLKKGLKADAIRGPALLEEAIGCAITSDTLWRMTSETMPVLPEIPPEQRLDVVQLTGQPLALPGIDPWDWGALYESSGFIYPGVSSSLFEVGGEVIFRAGQKIYRTGASNVAELPALALPGALLGEDGGVDYSDVYLVGDGERTATLYPRDLTDIARYGFEFGTDEEDWDDADWESWEESDWEAYLEREYTPEPPSEEYSGNRRILTVAGADGQILARTELPMEVGNPLLLFDNRLLAYTTEEGVLSYDSQKTWLGCWDIDTGGLLWKFDLTAEQGSHPNLQSMPVYWQGAVYFAWNNSLYRLSRDGSAASVPLDPGGSPLWMDIALVPEPDRLSCIVGATGSDYGSYTIGLMSFDSGLRQLENVAFPLPGLPYSGVSSSALTADAFYAIYYDTLHAFDRRTGQAIAEANVFTGSTLLGTLQGGEPVVKIAGRALKVFSGDLGKMHIAAVDGETLHAYQNSAGNCCLILQGGQGEAAAVQIAELFVEGDYSIGEE